jgi:clan AA aspartic protease (TIGR02281 family)
MRLFVSLVVLFGFALVGAGAVSAQEKITLTPAEAKAALEAGGFKVATTGVTLVEEADFAKKMKELLNLRKALQLAEKELAGAELELEQVKAAVTNLKKQSIQMNATLAGGGLDVSTHNKIVGALNATSGQIDLLLDQQTRSSDKIKAARGKANEAREAYVEQVLALRTSADLITQHWDKAAADPKQQAAIEAVNEVLKKKLALKPSVAFGTAERQLKSIEEKVLSETIKLTRDGDTQWASVVINGKHTKQMVVDTGATSISLPFAMAKEMGLEPTSQDTEIRVGLADGSEVPGYLKTIPSVRVGRFTVENVECVVLGPQAVRAPALLGMSFLGQFKIELDANRAELKMVKVDIEATKPKK